MSLVLDNSIEYDRGEVIYLMLVPVLYYSGDHVIGAFLDKSLAEQWCVKYNREKTDENDAYIATHFITTAQPKDFPPC